MDDDVSQSSDSVATSEEYEFIGSMEPELQLTGNVNASEIKCALKEAIGDGDTESIKREDSPAIDETQEEAKEKADSKSFGKGPHSMTASSGDKEGGAGKPATTTDDKVTKEPSSNMYATSPSPVEEGKLVRSTSLPVGEGECTLFNRIIYLGCAAINAPRSEPEIHRNMAILNEQSSEQAIEITLSVPSHSEGSVILYEHNSSVEITSFPIHRIIFCSCGKKDSPEAACFAFTCSHGSTAESAIFQCHIFKCDIPEAVVKILQTFASAFRKVPKLTTVRHNSVSSEKSMSVGTSVKNNEHTFAFEATLDIREEDSKGGHTSVPKDKDYFKLRCNLEKKLVVTVQQISNGKELQIERCFGLLISPGRNVKHGDMQLAGMVSTSKQLSGDKIMYQISGVWNPTEPPFEVLNTETARDTRVYMTVAVDLVVSGIREPVRFVIETKAKIFPQNERFWYFTKKTLQEQFYLKLREIETENTADQCYEIVSIVSSSQMNARKAAMSLTFVQGIQRPSIQTPSTPGDQESDSDNDEPLLSGTGKVSKDCSEVELEGWAELLPKWHQNLRQRPKQVAGLVRKGIPEALRGEVWQLLAGCHDDREMMETYRILITKDSPCDNVIQRDISRTFPAHAYFRESGGVGQDSLYKICKAYSIYDQEIGYCQGLSFLAATLLLHMPEEQAFSVLAKIMSEYGLRNLFRNGFEELHLKFYILERLMEDQMPELYAHFADLGVEAHMFGSQWFLTLFTAKFPLCVVFYILDLFLLDGMDTLFQVALALLMLSKKSLLALDFEGILKHFRVTLPKKYRLEEDARQLLYTATNLKLKKIKKYEKEYQLLKEQEKQQEDPVQRLMRENKKLAENNMRLEQENDDLAMELINSKLQLKKSLDVAEDKVETLTKELLSARTSLVELEDEKRRLDTEVTQLKEMCRRELQRTESEIARNNLIIAEYKQICNQLSSRLEKEQTLFKETIERIRTKVKTCDLCCKLLETADLTIKGSSSKRNKECSEEECQIDAEKQIRELELELAQTKLALVEAECKNQDLIHQLNAALAELQASKNTWFQKTLSSIKDVTRREYIASREGKEKEAT